MNRETDNFEDRILDDLLTDSMNNLYPIEDLLADDQNDLVEPSAEFQANMEAMFAKERKKIKRQKRRMMIPRVVAGFAIFLVVGFVSINQVPAWREPIYNFFFQPSSDGDKTKVEITEGDDEAEFEKYMPQYVPEGFELSNKYYDKETEQYQIRFESGNSNFIIFILPQNDDFYVDPSNFEKITYNNYTYYMDDNNRIMWISNHSSFYINSDLNKHETLKIADSIK